MSSISNIFNIARTALIAHQKAMNTIGHNVANVDTEGYSRQRPIYSTLTPFDDGTIVYGSGVEVERVQRYKADYIERQLVSKGAVLGKWEVIKEGLDQVEGVFTGIGERDLGTLLSGFFDAWDALAIDGKSYEYRQGLINQAVMLTNKLNDMGNTLHDIYNDTNDNIKNTIEQINDYTAQIAELNGMIKSTEINGGSGSANDLRDKRQLIVRKLARLIDVKYNEETDGMMTVTTGGYMLVGGIQNYEMTYKTVNNEYGSRTEVYLTSSNDEIDVSGGQLGGYITFRDNRVAAYIDTLNEIAAALVENVNREHSIGFDLNGETGRNFFNPNGTDAVNITVNPEIIEDPNLIAVASGTDTDSDGLPDTPQGAGDTEVALRISNLRNLKVFSTGSMLEKTYELYSQVGFDTQEASFNQEDNDALYDQLLNSREEQVGVSIDEEMSQLIQIQNSYSAAAKLMQVVSDMMDTVIQMI